MKHNEKKKLTHNQLPIKHIKNKQTTNIITTVTTTKTKIE